MCTVKWNYSLSLSRNMFGNREITHALPYGEKIRRDPQIIPKTIKKIESLEPGICDEMRARIQYATPSVLVALRVGRMAQKGWREVIAEAIYENWLKRTGQVSTTSFASLSKRNRASFFLAIKLIIESREKT